MCIIDTMVKSTAVSALINAQLTGFNFLSTPNGEEDTPRSQVSTCDGPPAVPRTAAKTVAFLSVSGLLCDVPGSYWVTYCTFSSSLICSNDSYLLVLLVQFEPG